MIPKPNPLSFYIEKTSSLEAAGDGLLNWHQSFCELWLVRSLRVLGKLLSAFLNVIQIHLVIFAFVVGSISTTLFFRPFL